MICKWRTVSAFFSLKTNGSPEHRKQSIQGSVGLTAAAAGVVTMGAYAVVAISPM